MGVEQRAPGPDASESCVNIEEEVEEMYVETLKLEY